MYDVYWYCQMKKNEWLWKFWKRNDYENFEKRGVVEKRREEETKSMPHAPVAKTAEQQTTGNPTFAPLTSIFVVPYNYVPIFALITFIYC